MTDNGSTPVPLSDLVEDAIGGVWGNAVGSADSDDVPVLVIRGADFRDWDVQRAANAALRMISPRALARRELRLGDLVLEVSGGGPSQPVGRVVVIDEKTLDGATRPLIPSNFCRRIRLKPGSNPYFVKRQLDWLYRNGDTDQYQTSSTNIRNLQVGAFLEGTLLTFPAPEEQERITKLCDNVESQTTSIQSRMVSARNYIQQLRQSALAAACSGSLTANWRSEHAGNSTGAALLQDIIAQRRERQNAGYPAHTGALKVVETEGLFPVPESWSWVTWNDLADWITYGFTRPMPHVDEGVPVVTAKNVRDGRISFDDTAHTTSAAFATLSSKDIPQPDEILLTKDGSIGRVAIVQEGTAFCINQSVALIRFGGLSADPRYLKLAIEAPFTQQSIAEAAKGSAIQHIAITAFGRLKVPLPPLDEQAEIVRVLNAVMFQATLIEERLLLAEARLQRLLHVVLSAALARRANGDLPKAAASQGATRGNSGTQ